MGSRAITERKLCEFAETLRSNYKDKTGISEYLRDANSTRGSEEVKGKEAERIGR
jgi:hypothetical protein